MQQSKERAPGAHIVPYDRERWGEQGYAFFFAANGYGAPVLVSAADSVTGQLVVVSPVVRIGDEKGRIFKVRPERLEPLTQDEFYKMVGVVPGKPFPEPVDLDDYDLKRIEDFRQVAEVIDFAAARAARAKK